ncbi:hypothetical protein [Mesorhizobium sp. WSM3859]|uniref:hypothetical protein n=1 Tax=Mesorhizobium sp. WSM3859 TaxID=2029402 RepID=UPI001596B900|nr:hypothetical protein [Mesorhizobium sp. WSM3859]
MMFLAAPRQKFLNVSPTTRFVAITGIIKKGEIVDEDKPTPALQFRLSQSHVVADAA